MQKSKSIKKEDEIFSSLMSEYTYIRLPDFKIFAPKQICSLIIENDTTLVVDENTVKGVMLSFDEYMRLSQYITHQV